MIKFIILGYKLKKVNSQKTEYSNYTLLMCSEVQNDSLFT
jgi:hypothetical protein